MYEYMFRFSIHQTAIDHLMLLLRVLFIGLILLLIWTGQKFGWCSRGWRNVDFEPRVGGGGSGRRPKKKSDLANFDGGSGQ